MLSAVRSAASKTTICRAIHPGSWWPLMIALSASVTAVAVALWLPWLIAAGGAMVIATAAGLVFEYYTGPEKH